MTTDDLFKKYIEGLDFNLDEKKDITPDTIVPYLQHANDILAAGLSESDIFDTVTWALLWESGKFVLLLQDYFAQQGVVEMNYDLENEKVVYAMTQEDILHICRYAMCLVLLASSALDRGDFNDPKRNIH